MSEPEFHVVPYLKLIELMVKERGLHEGIWSLRVEFGLAAMNAGPTPQEVLPSALVPVRSIGIVRDTAMGPLSVDAAAVNPAPKRTAKRPKKASTGS